MGNSVTDAKELTLLMDDYFAFQNSAITSLINPDSLACKSGCSFCCHLHITVKPYEVLPLVEHYFELTDIEKELFQSKVNHNCELIEESADEDLLLINFDCPFLVHDSCSVYQGRPTSCRAAHSRSVEVCEKAYNYPDIEIESDHIEGYTDTIRSIEHEFEEQLGEYHDVSDYNMNMALREAIKDPNWITRFLDGDEVFSDDALSRI